MKNHSISFTALTCALALLCSCASTPTSNSGSAPTFSYEVIDEAAGSYRITPADPPPATPAKDALTSGYGAFVGTLQTTAKVGMIGAGLLTTPLYVLEVGELPW